MAQVEDPREPGPLGQPRLPAPSPSSSSGAGCGSADAVTLPWDCTVTDADGAPYLRYYNTKMKREALVPIDDELRPT